MPEYIVTLTSQKQGGWFWPFLRGLLACLGGIGVLLVVVFLLNTPDPTPERAIEAWRGGVQAYQNAYRKKPVANPDAGIVHHIVPAEPSATTPCGRYDDRPGCAPFDPYADAPTGATAEDCARFLLMAREERKTNPVCASQSWPSSSGSWDGCEGVRSLHSDPECRKQARKFFGKAK
jgi:hypothetical protein